MAHQNPIISGFHPNPSICKVDDTYYLVTTSYHYFPSIPIYTSTDLINWRQIGYCLSDKQKIKLDQAHSSAGILRSTIRNYKGTFYVVTTNISNGGHFIIHTKNPSAEWSNPIPFPSIGGIDPSLFFDDDGTVYFTYSSGSHIQQFTIDLHSGKPLTESQPIWQGTGGQNPEAPHLYKFGDYYYLLITEGGTQYGRMVTLARSKSPFGKFEAYPNNPILTHRSTNNPIQALGYADITEDEKGKLWAVFSGIRPVSNKWHHLGGETFLAPVHQTNDNWLYIGNQGTVSFDIDMKATDILPPSRDEIHDDFVLPELELWWNFIRTPHDSDWSLDSRPGWLRLNGSGLSLDAVDSPAFVGRRQQHLRCTVTALLEFEPKNDHEEAGLTIYMDEKHHAEIGIIQLEGERYIIIRKRIGSLSTIVRLEEYSHHEVVIEIDSDPFWYQLSYHSMSNEKKTIASVETRYVSAEVTGSLTGVYLGMYATGNGNVSEVPAYFDWFKYIAKD